MFQCNLPHQIRLPSYVISYHFILFLHNIYCTMWYISMNICLISPCMWTHSVEYICVFNHWNSLAGPCESESEVAQSCPTLCDPVNWGRQVPLSMGFSRQEYWSGLPFPSPYLILSGPSMNNFSEWVLWLRRSASTRSQMGLLWLPSGWESTLQYGRQGFDPGQGTKFPHASKQLSPQQKDPAWGNRDPPMLQLRTDATK